MKLEQVLLDILLCPDCKRSLTVDNDNEELTDALDRTKVALVRVQELSLW